MKLRTLALAAVLTASLAAPAFAAAKISATLSAPVAAKVKVVTSGAVFACEADTCVAAAAPSRALSASACKDLVKEVGAVTAFGAPKKQLDADDLAQCNAVAAN